MFQNLMEITGHVTNDNIDYIYSGEAFWIKVDSASGSLTFDEGDKAVQNDNFNARTAKKVSYNLPLKMNLTYSRNPSYLDYSVLRFGGDSNTVDYDNTIGEALKVPNSYGTYPNIASTSGNVNIYYNNLNPNDSNMTIPLYVGKHYSQNRVENYNLQFEGIGEWTKNNHCLILNDTKSNNSKKLDAQNDSYAWSIHDSVTSKYLYLGAFYAITD